MKTLSTAEAIELLPADAEARAEGSQRFAAELWPANESFGALEDAVRDGRLESEVLWRDTQQLFTIWWFKDYRRSTMVIVGVASLTQSDRFAELIASTAHIARREGCAWLQFQTKRRGLARKAAAYGFTVDTVVCLSKVT